MNTSITGGLEDFSRLLRLWLPVAFWVLLMVGISTEAGSMASSDSLLRPLLLWFNPDLGSRQLYEANVVFRKICHLTEFAILAILLFRTRDLLTAPLPTHGFLRQAALPLGISALLAAGTEAFQLTTTRRSASLGDVLLNILGAGLGLAAVFFYKKWRASRRQRPLRLLVATGVDLTRPEDTAVLENLWETLAATRPAALILTTPPGATEDAPALFALLAETARPARVFLCATDERWTQAGATLIPATGLVWQDLTLTHRTDSLQVTRGKTFCFHLTFSPLAPPSPSPVPLLHFPPTTQPTFLLLDLRSGVPFGPFHPGEFAE